MKFTVAIVATFFAAFASAQAPDPSELPACALPCFVDNVAVTDCTGVEDYECLCASPEYDAAVTQCVLGVCSLPDALSPLAPGLMLPVLKRASP